MKKTHEKLTALLEKIQLEIEKRQTIFDNRSDKWQESEKGENYQFKTDELESIVSDLENAIDSINDWIEDD